MPPLDSLDLMTAPSPLPTDELAATGQANDDVDLSPLEEALRTSLADATDRTKDELRRLASYRAPPPTIDYPKSKLAAVLLLLHLNPLGTLSVTLTTRSKKLRSHPGETALPGGRWEEGDGEGGGWTALREANEEIGLPLPPRSSVPPSTSSPSSPPSNPSSPSNEAPHLLYLSTLPAFTSRTLLVVLPIIYILLKPASRAGEWLDETLHLNEDEVDAVFHLPLRSFLLRDSDSPDDDSRQTRSRPRPGTETLTHTFQDFTWLLSRPYRLHSFSHRSPLVTPSPITGLTADIVLETALLAQAEGERRAGFVRRASGQLEWGRIVEEAVRIHREDGGGRGERGLGGRVGGREGDERTSAT
ncbi:hypothetical protein NBRC10513v2_006479 [Rhodotorula toruloides]